MCVDRSKSLRLRSLTGKRLDYISHGILNWKLHRMEKYKEEKIAPQHKSAWFGFIKACFLPPMIDISSISSYAKRRLEEYARHRLPMTGFL